MYILMYSAKLIGFGKIADMQIFKCFQFGIFFINFSLMSTNSSMPSRQQALPFKWWLFEKNGVDLLKE